MADYIPRGAYPTGTTFSTDLKRFGMKIEQQNAEIFLGIVGEAARSVIEGSQLTGAPGQPVQTGNLKASWQTTFESPTVALISTNVEYAPIIEYNVRGATLRSAVGGFHSVAQTIAGIDRIIDAEIIRVTEGRGG